jgi:integrase/recombinase XerD
VCGGQRPVSGAAGRVAGDGPAEGCVDPVAFHAACLEAYEASQVARGFSQTTMDNWAGVLEWFLVACGRPAWR